MGMVQISSQNKLEGFGSEKTFDVSSDAAKFMMKLKFEQLLINK